MPPPSKDINEQFGAMNLNAADASAVSAEEEKAQSAIDDIFAEIKPVNTSGAPPQQIDAAQLFDFGSSDTTQGVAQ